LPCRVMDSNSTSLWLRFGFASVFAAVVPTVTTGDSAVEGLSCAGVTAGISFFRVNDPYVKQAGQAWGAQVRARCGVVGYDPGGRF
jgi:hypothetical protein